MSKVTVKELLGKAKDFVLEGMWMADLETLSRFRRNMVQLSKILFTTFRGYQRDACGLQASALTYISLVSLVPMLAIMFSFSKGVGFQERLYDAVGVECVLISAADPGKGTPEKHEIRLKRGPDGKALEDGIIAQLPEAMQDVALQVLRYVDNTNFAAMGLVGTLMLVVSVVMSIAKLETCFNVIWGVDVPRGLLKKFTEYLVILIVAPVLFITVMSMNSFLMSSSAMGWLNEHAGSVASMIALGMKLVGLCLVFVFFAFFYMFMPHTRVRAKSALFAGAFAGILWCIALVAYLKLQIGLAKFNTIYGTFAALPFFLAIIYAHWCIVLLGGEFSYAVQYHRFMRIDKGDEPMPAGACLMLGQLAMYEACKAYAKPDEGTWNPELFGVKHSIPMRQLRYAVRVLVQAKLLLQVNGDDTEDVFVPGCPPHTITPASVENAFRAVHSADEQQYFSMLPTRVSSLLQGRYEEFAGKLSEVDYGTLVSSELSQEKKA